MLASVLGAPSSAPPPLPMHEVSFDARTSKQSFAGGRICGEGEAGAGIRDARWSADYQHQSRERQREIERSRIPYRIRAQNHEGKTLDQGTRKGRA